MSGEERACPRCGGKMVRGKLYTPVGQSQSPPMSPFLQGGYMTGIPTMGAEAERRLRWEEGTGERKGFLFKREEKRRMGVSGFRCTLCGYIELYAGEKG